MDGVGADATVVVLQAMQPLTTDLGALGDDVVVLTDGPPHRAVRADAPAPSRVVSRPRHQWNAFVAGLADADPVEVVTNDEFCLAQCAEIRGTAGCARVTPEGLDGYLDKVVMKQRLTDAGVPVPPWAPLEPQPGTASDAVPGALRFPVVVKPRVGANSHGVQVIRNRGAWRSWVADAAGQAGWQVEEFVQGRMCFVDALVVDGRYEPVLVGRYLGGLLPGPHDRVLGAVSVPHDDPLWERAATLGQEVAAALGKDGRFATHLEFFERGAGLVVMEVCARAPGAMVSEMARIVSGANLETAHLRVQAGLPPPAFAATGRHAAWVSVLATIGDQRTGPPAVASSITAVPLPAPPAGKGRYVAVLALLENRDLQQLRDDVATCTNHGWHR